MKTLVTFILLGLFTSLSNAQEKNITTQSVTLENLIPFIVNNYNGSNKKSEALESKNITFLLQTSTSGFSFEDKIILKQAFKVLSNSLSEDDLISIVTYSGINGIALKQTSSKELKKLLYIIEHIDTSVKELYEDGIELAYSYTKENFIDDALNSVIMIRNPKTNQIAENTNNLIDNSTQQKKKNNAVLLTAITLLPEIIAVIKD